MSDTYGGVARGADGGTAVRSAPIVGSTASRMSAQMPCTSGAGKLFLSTLFAVVGFHPLVVCT